MTRASDRHVLKSFLLIFLPVAIIFSGMAMTIIHFRSTNHIESTQEHASSLIVLETQSLESMLETPLRDTLFLAMLAERHFAEEGMAQGIESLRKELTLLGQSQYLYDQLRLLDAKGNERIRIDFDHGHASIPANTDLQNKSHRYYFKRGIACEPGLFLSRFDLNVEHGVIETPHKPTIRVAASVKNEQNSPQGVVVLNFRGDDLLQRLLDASANSDGQLLLVNTEGKWLLGPNRHLDFGFLVPGNDTGGFAEIYPDQWKTIRDTGFGQFRDHKGLFTYRTLRLPSVGSGDKHVLPVTEEVLTLISMIPSEELVPTWRTTALAAWVVMLVLVAAISMVAAHARAANTRTVEAMAKVEKRLSYALDGSRDGVWDWDAVTNKVAFSRRWKEMLGYEEDEISDDLSEWETRIHPDDREQVFADLTPHLEGKTPYYENTHRMRCKDGTYRWILDRGKVVKRSEDGTPLRAVGTHTDITKRVEAEKALELSRRSLAQAQSIARLGNWELPLDTGVATCSDELFRIIGLKATEPVLPYDKYLSMVHEEDRDRLNTFIKRISHEGGSYSDRHRIIRPDGEERWVEGRGEAHKNADGTITRLSGTIQDITERVLAQQAINERETMLRAMSQASHDAIVVINHNDEIMLWNPAAERLFGYTQDEAFGQPVHKLIALPADHASAVKGLKHFAYSGQGPVVGTIAEMTAVHKDGTTFPVERSVASFHSDGHWYAVGSLRDITERKKAERRLRELATTDGLTNLNNRRHFMELGAAGLRHARRYGEDLAAIMFDVDHFKNVNDTYGHDAGDEVLRVLSALAMKTFRDVDIVGRLGGEEFGVILPQATTEEALVAAERMREAVAAAVIPTGAGELTIRISIGVASLEQDVEHIDKLLKHADLALYAAKSTGRNKVVAFDPKKHGGTT